MWTGDLQRWDGDEEHNLLISSYIVFNKFVCDSFVSYFGTQDCFTGRLQVIKIVMFKIPEYSE